MKDYKKEKRKSNLAKKNLGSQRGITLVALIITIIVLVILAAVAINVALNTGIINFATKGVKDYAEAGVEENRVMNKAIDFMESTTKKIEGILGGNGGTSGGAGSGGGSTPSESEPPTEGKVPETLADAMNQKYEFKENKTYKDGDRSVTIPAGFHIVGPNDYNEDNKKVDYGEDGAPNISDGIVIEDGHGNQFVWIPVSKDGNELTRTNFDASGNPTNTIDEYYTEPCNYGGVTGYTYEKEGQTITEADDFNEMKKQVIAYEGFYIGRYEAGVDSAELRTQSTEAQKIVIKAGVAPYNYVKWGNSLTELGDRGAVYLAKNKYEDNPGSVVSTLVYGSQWDAMCRFIGPDGAKKTTQTKSAPGLTGSVPTDKVKNIYDLAGNCFEWTMEAQSTYGRVKRGGDYDSSYPVSYRGYGGPVSGEFNDIYGFHPALYIKGTPES